jgi:hypothetical protein
MVPLWRHPIHRGKRARDGVDHDRVDHDRIDHDRIDHAIERRSSFAVAFRHTQIRSRIDRLSGYQHLEIYMRADSDSRSSNNTELLACRDGSFALSKRWRGHAQVAVDGDEAVVLDQDFESTWTLLLGYGSTCWAQLPRSPHPAVPADRRHDGRCPPGVVREHARTERRGDARGTDRWHQHQLGLRVRACAGRSKTRRENRCHPLVVKSAQRQRPSPE